jgi:hypothetical protein
MGGSNRKIIGKRHAVVVDATVVHAAHRVWFPPGIPKTH